MTREEHVKRHDMLDKYLVELVSDYLTHNHKMLTEVNILTLMRWSNEQVKNPTERRNAHTKGGMICQKKSYHQS